MMDDLNWLNILIDLYIIYIGFNYGKKPQDDA